MSRLLAVRQLELPGLPTVRSGRPSRWVAKIVLHKDGLEKLGLPLGKNEVGPGVRRRC